MGRPDAGVGDGQVKRVFRLGDHRRLTVRVTNRVLGHASPQRAVLLHDDGYPVVGDGFLRDDVGNAVERQQGDPNRPRKQRATANRQRRGAENNRYPHRLTTVSVEFPIRWEPAGNRLAPEAFALIWHLEEGYRFLTPSFDDDEEVPDEAMLLAACFILANSDEEWVKETVEAIFDAGMTQDSRCGVGGAKDSGRAKRACSGFLGRLMHLRVVRPLLRQQFLYRSWRSSRGWPGSPLAQA